MSSGLEGWVTFQYISKKGVEVQMEEMARAEAQRLGMGVILKDP